MSCDPCISKWGKAMSVSYNSFRAGKGLKGLSLEPGVQGQNMALHAPPTTRNYAVLISDVPVHSVSYKEKKLNPFQN